MQDREDIFAFPRATPLRFGRRRRVGTSSVGWFRYARAAGWGVHFCSSDVIALKWKLGEQFGAGTFYFRESIGLKSRLTSIRLSILASNSMFESSRTSNSSKKGNSQH